MTSFSFDTVINAPQEQVWQVLSDFGGTYHWNPSVIESHTTTDESGGVGAGRKCDLGNGQWTEEEITDWKDGELMQATIVNSNVPISTAVVTFNLIPNSDSSTRVKLHIDYKLKYGPVGVLMDLVMVRRMYRKTMSELLAGLKHHVETGEEIGIGLPSPTSV